MPSTETIHSNSNNNNNNNNNSSNSNSQTLTPSLGDNSLDSHLLSSPLAIHASPTAAGGCNNTTTSYPTNEDASSSTTTTMTSSISPQSPSTAATSPTPSSPTNSSPPSSPSSQFSFTQRSGGGGGTSHVKRIWESQGLQALWKFKLNDLRNELKNRGLNSSGNKPNIINRLHSQYLAESAPSSSNNNNNNKSTPSSSSSSQQQQQQQKSLLSPLSMFEDHGDRSAPSSCSPPNSPTTTITTSSSSSSSNNNNNNHNNSNSATSSTSSSSSAAAPPSSTVITTDSDTSTTAPVPSPPATTSTSSTTSKSSTNSSSPPSSSSSSQNPTSTTTTISNNTAGNSGTLVKPPSRLPPFVSMGSIPHPSTTTGGPFYPSMSIAPPSRPKILVKPPSVIIPPPQPIIPSNMIPTRTTTDKSGASLISRPTSSSASAANSTTATSTAATNSNGSSNGPSNGSSSSSSNGTASNNNTNQRLNTLSARRRVAQKGMSIKSTKPAISASAAVLMNMSDTPMSPPTPRTALSALKIKPPAIIMPKPMTPLTDQSKYMTFSPHSSAQFLPFQKSHSSASRVRALKRRAAAAAAAAASSSSKASSSSSQSGNSGKAASRPYTSGKKLQQQHQHHHHHQHQQQMKKRGRPGKSLSKMYDHVPESELISLGPSRSSHVSSGMVRTIDYGSTSGIRQSGGSSLKSGLHHRQQLGSASGSASSSGVRLGGTSSGGGHHQHSRPYAHGAQSAETSSSSSSSSESESESDEGDCYDYLVGSDDENFMNDTTSSTSTYHHQHHHQASESASASASSSVHHDPSDHIESIVPTGAVNLIEDYIANGGASNRKRSFGLDDADFYGDISYSTDASPCKRRKSEDIFDIGADDDDFMSGNAGSAGTGGEDDDEEYDDEPFFFCGITQEVPESIQESNLMEQTMGALQSEYSFEVTINRNGGVHSVEKSVNLLSFMGSGSAAVDDTETRKLSVGGNITLHELTKSIVELFTYDRYGGLGDGLGIDSDSKYSMSLPCGTELCSPDANQSSSSQCAVRSSEDLRVVGAKLGNHDAFYIIFPCADDPLREFCRFTVRVENIAITSSNDDTDLLLTDEDNESGLLGGALSDSYLNNYDGDNDSDDGCPSEEENAAQSGDDDMLQLMDSHLLLTI